MRTLSLFSYIAFSEQSVGSSGFVFSCFFSFCYFLTLQEDLLIHGDSVYDIIDKQDHGSIQAELSRSVPQQTTSSGSHHHNSSLNATGLDGEHRMFLCRMNVSRNARRQMRFGDQKVNTQQQLLQLGHKNPLTNR